jgi:transcriptional regulator with XRE-family HTH domain
MEMALRAPVFGHLLTRLRRERGLSQLVLAVNAAASSRHVSFLETGRAKPSEAMVARLASALDLDPNGLDHLRVAAGFCARHAPRVQPLAARIFESALVMEHAASAGQVMNAASAILAELGIAQFFFGTLYDGSHPGFDWANFGTFPAAWLQRYDREHYAMTDPLLGVVRARDKSFFWDDVLERRTLKRPAREMFERVEAQGYLVRFRCFAPPQGSDSDCFDDGIKARQW